MNDIKRKRIFCEESFLDSLMAEWGKCHPIKDSEKIKHFQATHEMLMSEEVLLDVSADRKEECFKKYTWLFMKEKPAKCVGTDFPEPDSLLRNGNKIVLHKYLFSIILSNGESTSLTNISRRYGIPALNVTMISNNTELFSDTGQSIDLDKYYSWYDLLSGSKDKYSSNTLLILDRYLIKDKKTIDDNLIPILKFLLPKNSIQIPFQIVICAMPLDTEKRKDALPITPALVSEIKTKIKSSLPLLLFTLTVYACQVEDFHDRDIVSNNYMLNIGGGFDILRHGKAEKSSSIHILYPFFFNYVSTKNVYRNTYMRICNDYVTMLTKHRRQYGDTIKDDRFSQML